MDDVAELIRLSLFGWVEHQLSAAPDHWVARKQPFTSVYDAIAVQE